MRSTAWFLTKAVATFGLLVCVAGLAAGAACRQFDGTLHPLAPEEMAATLGLQTADYVCYPTAFGCCEGLGVCPRIQKLHHMWDTKEVATPTYSRKPEFSDRLLACGQCPDCYQCTDQTSTSSVCYFLEGMTCTTLPDADCGDLVQGVCGACGDCDDCNGCDWSSLTIVGSCGSISQCQ